MKVLILLVAVIAVVLGACPEDNSISCLVANTKILDEEKKGADDETSKLFDKDVCDLTDDEASKLQPLMVKYAIDSDAVNKDTGVFDVKKLGKILDKEDLANMNAAICDAGVDAGGDVDSKIAAVGKNYLKREGKCKGLEPASKACGVKV